MHRFLLSIFLFSFSLPLPAFNFTNLSRIGHTPIRPSYSNDKYWIALPTRSDKADRVPPGSGAVDKQSSAQVDIFYIHPTMYLIGAPWNADIEDAKLNNLGDSCSLLQASAFNSSGAIYAPRYRQAHLKCFTRDKNPKAQEALDTAYSDVKRAFEYYLANWNKGRPIILVGHSQGAYHIARLMDDFFDGKPLLKQLVAAYPIGFNINKNRYKQIPVGESATQTGCFMTWNTVLWGQDTTGNYTFYRGSACVNPLTWTVDTSLAQNDLHHGGVPFEFNRLEKNVVRAKIHGTLLWIQFPDVAMKKIFRHLGSSFHVSDVQLFYMNIRENAELRVKTYLSKTGN